jgi:predicted lipoprotein with Yx(FWY)xxD motif
MRSHRQGSRHGAWGRTIVGAAAAGLLVLAACAKGTTTTLTSSPPPAPAVTLDSASVPGLGSVLVDAAGRTLYLLTAEQDGVLACTSATCVQAWPNVVLPAGTNAPTAGAGVEATLLGVVTGAGGTRLITYAGWPVHTFAGDSAAGQANGEGLKSFGGVWEALTAAGTPVPPAATSPSPSPRTSPLPVASPARVISPTTAAPTHAAPVPSPSPTVAAFPTLPSPIITYTYGY